MLHSEQKSHKLESPDSGNEKQKESNAKSKQKTDGSAGESGVPKKSPRSIVSQRGSAGCVTIQYASNVLEDWDMLSKFLAYAEQKQPDLVVLTNVFANPLDKEEQSAYTHALFHVKKAFKEDTVFSDIQPFIESFKLDSSNDIVTISARKILQQIESGKRALKKKVEYFKSLLAWHSTKIVIVPGPFENPEVIAEIDPDIASLYLSCSILEVAGIKILGVGGQATLDETAPKYFQNLDYVDGTEQANEELKLIFDQDPDALISYSPILYFTDSHSEEKNVRQYLSNYLPGKLVLTSQKLSKDPWKNEKLATDAVLIRGGHLSRSNNNEDEGCGGNFWQIKTGKRGLIEKQLKSTIPTGNENTDLSQKDKIPLPKKAGKNTGSIANEQDGLRIKILKAILITTHLTPFLISFLILLFYFYPS